MTDSVLGADAGLAPRPGQLDRRGRHPGPDGGAPAAPALAVGIASAVALPLALWLGHLGRGGLLASAVANIGRAIPTLSLVVIFFLLEPSRPFGARRLAALVIFAVPPILTNTYAGMREVDQDVVEAARGMGLTGPQVLARVELPLAVPLVIAGLRIATTQVIATATIAAFVAGPGLGRFINAGLGPAGHRPVRRRGRPRRGPRGGRRGRLRGAPAPDRPAQGQPGLGRGRPVGRRPGGRRHRLPLRGVTDLTGLASPFRHRFVTGPRSAPGCGCRCRGLHLAGRAPPVPSAAPSARHGTTTCQTRGDLPGTQKAIPP